MLKIALIIMVVVAVVLLLALIVFSVRLMRKAEKELGIEQRNKEYQVHPKLKDQHVKKQENKKDYQT